MVSSQRICQSAVSALIIIIFLDGKRKHGKKIRKNYSHRYCFFLSSEEVFRISLSYFIFSPIMSPAIQRESKVMEFHPQAGGNGCSAVSRVLEIYWIVEDFLGSLPWHGFLLYLTPGPHMWFHGVGSTPVVPLGTATNKQCMR